MKYSFNTTTTLVAFTGQRPAFCPFFAHLPLLLFWSVDWQRLLQPSSQKHSDSHSDSDLWMHENTHIYMQTQLLYCTETPKCKDSRRQLQVDELNNDADYLLSWSSPLLRLSVLTSRSLSVAV